MQESDPSSPYHDSQPAESDEPVVRPEPEDADLAHAPVSELRKLDPAVIHYWRVHSLINSLILLALLSAAGGIVVFNRFESWPIVGGVWACFLALRIWLLIWYPKRSYRAWSYRVDDNVLETRHGIWFKVVTLLPLSRLQHVDMERGPIERSFGLASLLLYTAGTQNATIPIPGLNAEEASKLRDQLVAAGGDDGV